MSTFPFSSSTTRNLRLLAIAYCALLNASLVAAVTIYNAEATGTAGYDATQVTGLVSRSCTGVVVVYADIRVSAHV
jgi:hypothetical protein